MRGFRARAQFATGNSDLLTDAKAYSEASKIGHYGSQRAFCEEVCLVVLISFTRQLL